MDPRLLHRAALEIVVRDVIGAGVDAEKLQEIPFGFDTEVVKGECYWRPSLGFYYWLREIEDE